jgi:hypothetical protein
MFARRPGEFVAVRAPVPQVPIEAAVSAWFHKLGGPPGGGYGLIVRDQGPGSADEGNETALFYVFEAGDRGELGIWRRDGDRLLDLVPWTRSEAVRPGNAVNELTVKAIGQQLTFLVNGIQVASQVDSALSDGAVGVFVGGELNEVMIERFAVQALK